VEINYDVKLLNNKTETGATIFRNQTLPRREKPSSGVSALKKCADTE
jgi:hypothetical protein